MECPNSDPNTELINYIIAQLQSLTLDLPQEISFRFNFLQWIKRIKPFFAMDKKKKICAILLLGLLGHLHESYY